MSTFDRNLTGYTYYYPGDEWQIGVTAVYDGAPMPDSLGELMSGHSSEPKKCEDLFDVALYGAGCPNEAELREESAAELVRVLDYANIGLRYVRGLPLVETIYVVSFAPYKERAAVGGFNWHAVLGDAERDYAEQVKHAGNHTRVRLVAIPTPAPYAPDPESREVITQLIDADLTPVELDLPAIREYVPVDPVVERIQDAKDEAGAIASVKGYNFGTRDSDGHSRIIGTVYDERTGQEFDVREVEPGGPWNVNDDAGESYEAASLGAAIEAAIEAGVAKGREPVSMVGVEVHYFPGDGNADARLDDDGPGYVAFAKLSDGTLSFPSGHPRPFAFPEQAEAVAGNVHWDECGAVYRAPEQESGTGSDYRTVYVTLPFDVEAHDESVTDYVRDALDRAGVNVYDVGMPGND